MSEFSQTAAERQAEHDIHELFLKRWSSRAMSGEPVSEATMHQLFEAARWAPSTGNEQEWRFLYVLREHKDWHLYFSLLAEGNQTWCQRAGALIVVLSKKNFSRRPGPNPTHSFDTGLAVQNMLLQATHLPDLVSHVMGGFDRGRARVALNIPEDVNVECMIAIGIAGNPELLPPDLQAREVPTQRKPVSEIARTGRYTFD